MISICIFLRSLCVLCVRNIVFGWSSLEPLGEEIVQLDTCRLFHIGLELRLRGYAAAIILEIIAQALVKRLVTHLLAQGVGNHSAFDVTIAAEHVCPRRIIQGVTARVASQEILNTENLLIDLAWLVS